MGIAISIKIPASSREVKNTLLNTEGKAETA
jgi:hypothetical protein